MNRIDRLMAIIILLQSKGHVTITFIAQRFGISIRTAYRDLKALEEIGIPVTFEHQKGYSILQSYFLPPVSLTTEEANAIVLISSLSVRFTDDSTKTHIENALTKIKTVLRTREKEKANLLQSEIRVYVHPTENRKKTFLTEIQSAITNQQTLLIEYTNNSAQKSRREIEPFGLTFYSNQWHLVAWCRKQNDYRDFKILQIHSLINKGIVFKKAGRHTLSAYIKSLE